VDDVAHHLLQLPVQADPSAKTTVQNVLRLATECVAVWQVSRQFGVEPVVHTVHKRRIPEPRHTLQMGVRPARVRQHDARQGHTRVIRGDPTDVRELPSTLQSVQRVSRGRIEAFAQKNEAEPSDGGRVHGSGDRCEE
jgi:hypothetical protein